MIYKNVKKIREAKGVTKTYLSKKLGMSLMGYSHIESGEVRLDVQRLITISVILDVPITIFFDN